MSDTRKIRTLSATLKRLRLLFAVTVCCFITAGAEETAVKQWTRQWGSTDIDYAYGVAVDSAGNTYVTGLAFASVDGQPFAGAADIVLTKFSASGEKQWTREWGTGSYDYGFGIALDSSGNIYVTGMTGASLNGQPYAGNLDVFLTKYDPSGVRQWTSQWGNAGDDIGYSAATNAAGDIFVTGYTASGGNNQVFLLQYNPSGVLQNLDTWGSGGNDAGNSVAVDASGNVYVAGKAAGSVDGQPYLNNVDIFLSKYNSSFVRQWTREWGTAASDAGQGVAVDPSGNIFVTGFTYGSIDTQPYIGNSDIFLSKYTASGDRSWTREWGNGSSQYGYEVSLDTTGYIYIAVQNQNTLFGKPNAGGADVFFVKCDPAGEPQCTLQWGTGGTETAEGVAVDGSGDVYIAGSSDGYLENQSNIGGSDLFMTKLHMNNPPVLSWTGEENYTAGGVYLRADGKYVYRITYTDQDNDAPASGYPKLHVKKDGAEITGSPFAMDIIGSSGDYAQGRIYEYALTSPGGDTSYYFEARDIHEEAAIGAPTQSTDSAQGMARPPEESKAKVYHGVFKPGESEQCYISYNAEQAGETKVIIYDRGGRQVKMLFNGSTVPGISSLTWDGICDDGNAAPSGVYVVRITAPGVNQRKNIVVIR